ncbi:hypothetical protein ABZ456_22545 [Streptomyces sp. NPDC005776]|uniref:hypothetical protein n=1 Tax=Streptomyces sp. NPDC005776 TaxID=3154676 RepID=UPI0033D97820
MEITEQDGIVIASIGPDEAEHRAWERVEQPPIDVVRLLDHERTDAADRARLGFLTRPRWVNWWAPVGASDEEFTARVSGTERRNIRLGRQAIQAEELRLSVVPGLEEDVLDEFLVVYDEQISGMARGKNYARRSRDRLLEDRSEFVSVCVYAGPVMVVGSIWWIRPSESLLQMRFSAASPSARSSRVMRAAYVEAFRFARESGLSYVSLGNDPSLFGHVVQPGLFNFKSRLGFSVIPSAVLDASLGGNFADKFLSLRALSDPALVVTVDSCLGDPPPWPGITASPWLDMVLLSGEPAPVTGAFRTKGFRSSSTLTVS